MDRSESNIVRLVFNTISLMLIPSIPVKPASFRPGMSCCDQVLGLTSLIEL